jgi:hypothetical protein
MANPGNVIGGYKGTLCASTASPSSVAAIPDDDAFSEPEHE